jgi:hypothetical protein
LLHGLKGGIYLWKRLSVSDELVDLELALHVVVNQTRKLGAALDSAKSTSLTTFVSNLRPSGEGTYLPDTASNELES